MKKLVLFTFLLQSIIFAGGDWLAVHSPTPHNLSRISFADSLYGWVSGDSGSFYRTMDGCKTWEKINLGTNEPINDHFFLNKSTGWAVTSEMDTVTFLAFSKLYKTVDSGSVWESSPFSQEDLYITKIFFFDSLKGLAGGVRGELFYTDDGGQRWNQARYDTNSITGFKIINFNFLNRNFGFACGGQYDAAGTIYRTVDGGQTWYGKLVNSEPVHSIIIFDSLNAMAFTGDFDYGTSILRTSDSGLSWVRDTVNFFGIPEASAQRSDREIWASLGFTGQFIFTDDSARTWHIQYAPDTIRVNDICFSDTMHGYAAGDLGKIYRFQYKDPVTVDEPLPNKVSTFKVDSYPNPFNPSTTLQYYLPARRVVTIRLYDILGRDAGLIFQGEQESGTHKQVITASALSAGVYICSITTGKEASYIKLLYLK